MILGEAPENKEKQIRSVRNNGRAQVFSFNLAKSKSRTFKFDSDSLNKSALQLNTGLSLDERLGLGWQLEGKLGHLGKQMTAGEVSTG